MRPGTWTSLATALMLFPLICSTQAAVYRVGPGEKYAKISELAAKLAPGDIVEVAGDIADNLTLSANGTRENPLTIRGITRVENGQIIRPEVISALPNATAVVECRGGANVIEGLAFGGFRGKEIGKGAVLHACSNLVLRNCHFHHNVRAVFADDTVAGDILLELCEFEANGYGSAPAVSLYSQIAGATATTRLCYFHDSTGSNSLSSCFARNVIRYNWFENPFKFAVQITTASLTNTETGHSLAGNVLPAHSDIVGNVFAHGWECGADGALQIGGSSPEAPGTEGDFNIAHNLFITRRGGARGQIVVTAHGNVERIRLYNNVILECRAGGCTVYERGEVWDGYLSQSFIRRRRSGDPVIEGANNWISATAGNVPAVLENTIRGTNPCFQDLVEYDFHPVKASPLVGAGSWPLPEGAMSSLLPEYEPQRGIPPDLKGRLRRKCAPPSIGPFEVSDGESCFVDDSADLVLAVRGHVRMMQWHLGYAAMRRKALECLSQRKLHEALSYARMQFILSPPDENVMESAIFSVKQMLVAVDGDEERAKAFDEYSRYGAAGRDGFSGTEDDLKDPIHDVGLEVFRKPAAFYADFDKAVQKRAEMGTGLRLATEWWVQRCFDTEKAFVRLEGAEFEQAVELFVPFLAEAARKPAEDTDRGGAANLRRNRDLLDRLEECLTAVARYRSGSLAGNLDFVKNHIAYARYGPAGEDSEMGTQDDIDISGLTRRGPLIAKEEGPDPRLESLKAAYDGATALAGFVSRLRAMLDAKLKAIHRMEFIARDTQESQPSCLGYMYPSPAEFLQELQQHGLASQLSLAGFKGEDVQVARSIYQERQRTSDRAVVEAFNRIETSGLGEGATSHCRAYLSAFVAGTHEESAYPAILTVLMDGMEEAYLPSFIVEDIALCCGDPFTAADVMDRFGESSSKQWRPGDAERLLQLIENGQHMKIRTVHDAISDPFPGEPPPDYESVISMCVRFLNRFPKSSCCDDVELRKGFCEYKAERYNEAMESLRSFSSRHPGSRHIPGALFVRGLAGLGLGRKEEALKELRDVWQQYGDSEFAARALYVAGCTYASCQEYAKAIDCLQAVVDFHAEDPNVPKAREMLRKIEARK